MRPESIAWERAAEVHAAARGWRRAGIVDAATEATIRARFPDPCVTPAPVWRALTGGIVAAVVLCAFAAAWIALGPGETTGQAVLVLFAAGCLVATEQLEAAPHLARRGAAGVTAPLAVGFLLAGLAGHAAETWRLRLDDAIDVVLAASALAWAAACRRWGAPLAAALSAASVFLLLARVPQGRLLWLLGGAALAALAARGLDDPARAPSRRRGAAVLVVVGLGALYAAVSYYSLDAGLIEALARSFPGRPAVPPAIAVLSALATAAVPLAVLAWGLRARRTFVLDTGIVLLALSLLTLRRYVHLAPLWAILTVAGAALAALALAVERALRRAPGGEIVGFTADALFSDERRAQAVAAVAVAAAFTPGAAGPAAAEPEGGGGRFGGGGATERF